MSRNGSGVYSKPAGTTAVANTSILSAKFNEVIDDIVTDLNTARPIVAGGTAATTASGARSSLGVDVAVAYATKSGDYTAVAADNNSVIRFSAAATLSLTAAATLGSGWHCTIIAGSGAVTVDPNSTEQIDGATTILIPTGFALTIVCTGTAFYTTQELTFPNKSHLTGHISGLQLSNNVADATNDIDIAAGMASDSAGGGVMVLSSSLTKRLDGSWAVGTGNGGLDTGSIANGTYHVWLIGRTDTGVVDALYSASATSPTMPTNYTLKRYVGPIVRASGAILPFTWNGDGQYVDVLWTTAVLDVDVTNQSTTAINRVLTVPLGIKVQAKMRIVATNASTWRLLVSSTDVTDVAPSNSAAPLASLSAVGGAGDLGSFEHRTDTSGQVRTRSNAASTTVLIATYGFAFTR